MKKFIKEISFWIIELSLAAIMIFTAVGAHNATIEEKYYASLNNDEKLQYIMDTYYQDINNFLGIAEKDRIDPANILVKDEMSPYAMGEYSPTKQEIYLRTEEFEEDLGQAVEILAHELVHHRQYLADNSMVTTYRSIRAGDDGYDDVYYEQDSEYNAHMYTASQGFAYYNGRGCTYTEWAVPYIQGLWCRAGNAMIEHSTAILSVWF